MYFEPPFPTDWPIQLGTKTGASLFKLKQPSNLETDVAQLNVK